MPRDVTLLKNQINAVLTQNQKYFLTLGEFIYNQVNSGDEQPTDDPNIDFQSFIHDTVAYQLEAMDKKIERIFNEFKVVQEG